jgi:hypothetical protein
MEINAGMVDSLKEGAKEKGRIENKNKKNRRKRGRMKRRYSCQ